MKKRFLLSLALLLVLGMNTKAYAADYAYLTLTEQDGTKTSLTAVGLTITFSDGNLVATNSTTSESKTLSLSNLASLSFTVSDETTGIDGVKTSFSIAEADAIYDLTGRQVPSGSSLPKGVYLIKKGSIIKKNQVK